MSTERETAAVASADNHAPTGAQERVLVYLLNEMCLGEESAEHHARRIVEIAAPQPQGDRAAPQEREGLLQRLRDKVRWSREKGAGVSIWLSCREADKIVSLLASPAEASEPRPDPLREAVEC